MSYRIPIFIACIISYSGLFAHYVLQKNYTISDGLPSNRVYQTLQDKKGFLWVATDNGVARFDGQRFKVYQYTEGLADNDVIEMEMDNEGRIWANSFMREPTYFDEVSNRFVKPSGLTENIKNKFREFRIRFLRGRNKKLYIIAKNGYFLLCDTQICKFHSYDWSKTEFISEAFDTSKLQIGYCFYKPNAFVVYLNQYGKKIDSQTIAPSKKGIANTISTQHAKDLSGEYFSFQNILLAYQNKISQKGKFISQREFASNILNISINKNFIALTFEDRSISLINKDDLSTIWSMNSNVNSNTIHQDDNHGLWISTNGQGIKLYRQNFHQDINAISQHRSSSIFVSGQQYYIGDFQGGIYQISHNGKYQYYKSKSTYAPVRGIVSISSAIFLLTDYQLSQLTTKGLQKIDGLSYLSNKSILKWSENEILLGGFGPNHQSIWKVRMPDRYAEPIRIEGESRINSMAKIGQNLIYASSSNGLIKINYNTKAIDKLYLKMPKLANKIWRIMSTKDSILWVCTVNDGLIIMKNDSILHQINDKKLFGAPISIHEISRGKMAIGTRNGLLICAFADQTYQTFTATKYMEEDGLPSNIIYDIAQQDSFLIMATEKGPTRWLIPKNRTISSIYIQPNEITINGESQMLKDKYCLESGHKSIMINLAVAGLHGGLDHLEYSINDTQKWSRIQDRVLNLELEQGRHTIYVRAIDRNLEVHQNQYRVVFEIKIPFYRSLWFWIVITLMTSACLFYWQSRLKISKERDIRRQENLLADQRNKITADLHDDIGASLSSLQISTAIIRQTFDKDQHAAMKKLEKLEEQCQKISEKIGDFIWSMKGSEDEFNNIESRVKNYAVEALAPLDINFSVIVDQEINEFIQDFMTKKNIILICKEAINNAAKYSKATEIHVHIRLIDHNILLFVVDNGIGIPNDAIFGNGLANMKKRSKEIGGEFTLDTGSHGTKIIVKIPYP